MEKQLPRVMIAGLGGDSGKTVVSLGLCAALRDHADLRITAFKKGPDYIDAAWLSAATGRPARNLDTFLMSPSAIIGSVSERGAEGDAVIIEGNRGLFDGFDAAGTHSTAELAKLLKCPVILVVSVTKVTRTVSAFVKGCQVLDPDLMLSGVILNRYATSRHRDVITTAVEQDCGIPVVGAIPRFRDERLLPDRHLGLITPAEHENMFRTVTTLARTIGESCDLVKIREIMGRAPAFPDRDSSAADTVQSGISDSPSCRIAYFSDSAFTFYYPENLEALEQAGAELIPLSSLSTETLPDVDGLYIGGGFPETHAEALAANRGLMASIKSSAEGGLPIYAECGGLIYLSRELDYHGRLFPMGDVFPVSVVMSERPAGHGYAVARVIAKNPYYQIGAEIRGHEFHYSSITDVRGTQTVLKMERGSGACESRDGLLHNRTFATYVHIHALGMTTWADTFCKNAVDYRKTQR